MISTVIAIHRVDEFTFNAINSMIEQQLSVPHEILVVANGPEADTIKQWLCDNFADRVRVFVTPIPQLSHALNIGIAQARYDLISRMDGDDISLPNRLQLQFDFLTCNDLDMVGCDLVLINERDELIGNLSYPKKNNIGRKLPFINPFAHNTVLVKKSILLNARGYNSGFNSEDYDLWLRLNRLGINWDNMPDRLVKYRIHSAASQRHLLGYAEATALAMREFILNKSMINFIAILYLFFKSLIRPRKD